MHTERTEVPRRLHTDVQLTQRQLDMLIRELDANNAGLRESNPMVKLQRKLEKAFLKAWPDA